jgi:putative methyltransferase (TIGR04325 family)
VAGIRARLFRTPHAGGRTFASHREAAAHCEGFGYETTELVELIFQKTEAYRARCSRSGPPTMGLPESLLLAALGMAIGRDPGVVRVLDFGGACGAHYFLTRAIFPGSPRLDWRVVETPAMFARAAALGDDELRFFPSIEAATEGFDDVDVVHSSSALQYTANPAEVLDSLLNLKAPMIVLTRLPLTTAAAPRIEIQESRLIDNGPGPVPPGIQVADKRARYPITFLPQAAFEAQFARAYALTTNVADASVFGSGQEGFTGRAYIATRK